MINICKNNVLINFNGGNIGTTSKKKGKLRDFGPKGREGSEKNQFFSLIRKRENYLRGGGVKSKSPFFGGNFIGKF